MQQEPEYVELTIEVFYPWGRTLTEINTKKSQGLNIVEGFLRNKGLNDEDREACMGYLDSETPVEFTTDEFRISWVLHSSH